MGLSGSSIILSARATRYHPDEPIPCICCLLHVSWWLHLIRKVGHSYLCVSRPNTVQPFGLWLTHSLSASKLAFACFNRPASLPTAHTWQPPFRSQDWSGLAWRTEWTRISGSPIEAFGDDSTVFSQKCNGTLKILMQLPFTMRQGNRIKIMGSPWSQKRLF